MTLTWEEFDALPKTEHVQDIHCVTRWSRFDARFCGVHWRDLAPLVRPRPSPRFAIAHAEQGFTANVPFVSLEDDHALLATEADGEPLTADHGWPLRPVDPRQVLLEKREWLRGIQLTPSDRPGFSGGLRLPQRCRPLAGGALRLLAWGTHDSPTCPLLHVSG